jgi:hypothetical protein
VHYSPNSLIYAYTWYLDNVCDNWVGLVEGDYESVFPLVWNAKLFGIKRLYQPYLCQQLGLFSINDLSTARIEAFINAIPKEYKHIDINLNDSNQLEKLEGFTVTEKPNYTLSLYPSYEKLRGQYSTNLKRNLKKAEKQNVYATTSIKPEDFVELVKTHQKEKGNIFPPALYHTALRIIYNCQHRGIGFLMGAYNEKQELCAAVFWMSNGARFINLMNVTTDAGKEAGAMHYLVDLFIQSNSGKPMFIDFEGSSIDSIARFYQSFGAENLPYYNIKQNKLPWWLKWKK